MNSELSQVIKVVAMAKLSTQMSLHTCLPHCPQPINTYNKIPLVQLVVLRGSGMPLNKGNIDNKNPIQLYLQTRVKIDSLSIAYFRM